MGKSGVHKKYQLVSCVRPCHGGHSRPCLVRGNDIGPRSPDVAAICSVPEPYKRFYYSELKTLTLSDFTCMPYDKCACLNLIAYDKFVFFTKYKPHVIGPIGL